MKAKAAAYIRVSTDEQARGGVSLEGQEERLRAFCTLSHLEVVRLIREGESVQLIPWDIDVAQANSS